MATENAPTQRRGGSSTERAQILCVELFERLEHDNELLRETLDNMTQGVVMFGANATLVVSNDRYIEMYGLSKDVIKPGCTLRQLLEHRRDVGLLTGDIGKYHDDILDQVRRKEVFSWEVTTSDGRAVHIVNQPMAGGRGGPGDRRRVLRVA